MNKKEIKRLYKNFDEFLGENIESIEKLYKKDYGQNDRCICAVNNVG